MKIIGLMSGTSGDGIDAALCEISGAPPHLQAQILHALTVPYSATFRQRILAACRPETSPVDELCRLNVDLGEQFAAAVLVLLDRAGLESTAVDLIGSHGQTVWHDVRPDGSVGATLQIAEAAVLAERTGITTISNFRARDVAAGGQGAPLTAYVDWLLLRHPTNWRAIQNIGGIANVTFLPPLSDAQNAPIAFDTGPGNMLIDAAASHFSGGQKSYDHNGEMARQGVVAKDWLTALLQHPYYARGWPKTTGRELFGALMAQQLIAEGQQRGLSGYDSIATLTALTAHSIADAYRRFAPAPVAEVILGGGGGRNPVLVELLRGLLTPALVRHHEDIGLDSDFKEALVFAVLAYETWHARPGQHPALTGASRPVILGQITPGENYVDLLRRAYTG